MLPMNQELRLDSSLMINSTNEDQDFRVEDMLPCRGNITPQIVERIESDLEFYEKVSLVFLLFDENIDIALQRLRVSELAYLHGSLPSFGLISDWAWHANSPHWEDKFLEALCIIQNYSIVEKLGYCKREVQSRFLPETPDVALFVDLMRKALYLLCEKMTIDQEKILIDLVKADESISLIDDETQFLEIRFLYWISQQYIPIQNRSADVTNLTKHFKVMEELHFVDYLESVSRRYESVDINDTIDLSDMVSTTEVAMSVASTSYSETHSTVSTFFGGVASNVEAYHIDPDHVGYAVIINQKIFYRERDPNLKQCLSEHTLEDRTGTDMDRDQLCKAFSHFGLTIKTWENLTHVKLLENIEFAAKNLVQEKHSCFVLCILSHGEQNQVFGVNSIAVSTDDIEKRIQGKYCPKLLNKPKIIIIQACQGRKKQEALRFRSTSDPDISVDGPPTSHERTCPAVSDSFIMWSTVRGYASFRNMKTGTWFIQVLCSLLLKATTGVDMEDIAKEVNREIKTRSAILPGDGDGTRKSMQPIYMSTLAKRLYLPCKKVAQNDVS